MMTGSPRNSSVYQRLKISKRKDASILQAIDLSRQTLMPPWLQLQENVAHSIHAES